MGLIALLIGFATLYQMKAASAQLSISAHPLIFKEVVDPGMVWEGSATVANPNSFAIQVKPEKENLSGGVEGEIQLTGETDQKYGLASWITFDEDKIFTLEPHGQLTIKFKVAVPANAQPGGHYGAVLFRGLTLDNTNQAELNGLGISGRVGTVLLFEVSGDVKKIGSITSIIAPKFLSRGPFDISFKVQNDGNTFFSPEGTVTFQNLWTKYTGTWEPRVVFPGYDRTFKTSWDKKYLFGPIKITIDAKMQDGGPTLGSKSIIIWAFPWQEASIVIGAILLVWLGVKWFKIKYKIIKVEK